jgi:hypothetical protein
MMIAKVALKDPISFASLVGQAGKAVAVGDGEMCEHLGKR